MMHLYRSASRALPVSFRFSWLAFSSLDRSSRKANSPWENAVNVLQLAFTSTIARGLSLVAIVVSGLTFAFGEGGSKRVLAGVLFGVGMAIAAVNFLAWLFPAASNRWEEPDAARDASISVHRSLSRPLTISVQSGDSSSSPCAWAPLRSTCSGVSWAAC